MIEWDEAESNYYPIDYYAVLRVDPNTNDPELLNILDPSILQHQDTTCQYDKNYSYFVVAVDDHGKPLSETKRIRKNLKTYMSGRLQ